MNVGMIVTGHGFFPDGLYDGLKRIAGEQENCLSVPFDTSESEDVFEALLREKIDALKDADQIVVFCDLVGGTPFKTAAKIKMENPKLIVVGGTNLPMLIEFAISRNYADSVEELVENTINNSKEAIMEFSLVGSFDDDEDEVEE